MKLSERIEQTCCGVLADKQEMVAEAVRLEGENEMLLLIITDLKVNNKGEK